MWNGVSLKDFENSIYRHFYKPRDIEVIRGADDVTLKEVKHVISRAKWVGDLCTVAILEEMYDELLYTPPKNYPPLPPRAELMARYNEMMSAAEEQLRHGKTAPEQ